MNIEESETRTGDRRRNSWTLWREIYGTVIGTLPFIVGLVIWASNVNQRLSVVELEISHNKELLATDRTNAREDRQELSRKLDRIQLQIEEMQKLIARDGGRAGR